MNSKEYINILADQYKGYIRSNKQLMDMIKTEKINNEWMKNYHVIDHDYIIQWKDLISYDSLTKKKNEEIIDIIKKNYIHQKKLDKLQNKNIYDSNKVNPMKSFDIISDDVWKLFDQKKENSEFNGKVSILKGNKKILVRFNENTYSVRYLTNDIEDLINEFIVNFDLPKNEEKKKKQIIDKILKDNIYNWMDNIKFKYHSKEFKAKLNDVPFEIKQKSNNYPKKDIEFNISDAITDDNCNFASVSNDSFSYSESYKNNTDLVSGLRSFLIEIQKFVTIHKYEQTSNVCSVMRCLSMIEPLSDYLMSQIKSKQIFNKYQSTSFLNIIKKYFSQLWSEENVFAPIEFIKKLEEKNFEIKEEQDPILFLNIFIDYTNKKLNNLDSTIKFNFNNIEKKLQNKSYANELKTIIDKSNSIIGQLFYGLILETYKCNKCDKKFEKIRRFETIDVEYREIIEQYYEEGNSFVFIDMNDFLVYYFLYKRLNSIQEKLEGCPNCKKEAEIIKREILEYPAYLIIRLKIGDYKEKEGFVNINIIPNLKVKFNEIKKMETYLANSLQTNKNNNNYEYELQSMVCYLKNNNKIEFISICQNIIENDKTWISFMCNNQIHKIYMNYEKLLEGLFKENTEPYILFYKLKK
mgnify:CR=1 FL=1